MSLSLLTGGMDQLYTVHDALGLHIRFGPSFKNNLLRDAPLAKTSCCDTKTFWWASASVSIDPCRSYLGRLKNLRKQSRRNISTASTAILETRMQPGLRRKEQIFVQRTAQNCPFDRRKGSDPWFGEDHAPRTVQSNQRDVFQCIVKKQMCGRRALSFRDLSMAVLPSTVRFEIIAHESGNLPPLSTFSSSTLE